MRSFYSQALVKKLQSRDCTFTQKAGFPMHFHCRLTAKICSVVQVSVTMLIMRGCVINFETSHKVTILQTCIK